MKKYGWLVMVAALLAAPAMATNTVATFADPSGSSNTPLFTVDVTMDKITGGWADSQTGLHLYVPWNNTDYVDAFFTMTDIVYTGDTSGGATGSGIIRFFEDNQDINTTPLVQITFDSGYINPYGFGGMDEFFGNGVVITGSQISGTLSSESFSFSFANQKFVNTGYTATAAFTSSAIPEPATMALFGLGAAALLRRRKRA